MGIDLAAWRARIGLNYWRHSRYACRPLPVQWRAARWGVGEVMNSTPLLLQGCMAVISLTLILEYMFHGRPIGRCGCGKVCRPKLRGGSVPSAEVRGMADTGVIGVCLLLGVCTVVLALLLIAGDVERNPGPTGKEESDQVDKVLTTVDDSPLGDDDLFDLLKEMTSIASSWKAIGIGLRIRFGRLETIQNDNAGNSRACLSAMLTCWLQRSYNVGRFGEPTWQAVVKVVADPAGGDNRALALSIAEQHQVVSVAAPPTTKQTPFTDQENSCATSTSDDVFTAEDAPSKVSYGPAGVSPGPSSVSYGPSSVSPGPSSVSSGPSSVSPGPSSVSHGPSSVSHGPSSVSHGPSSVSPGPSSVSHGPSSVSPGPSNVSHGPASVSPGPSPSTQSERSQRPSFGCGCGNCTFLSYLENGCPNPISTTSSFPYLNTSGLTDEQQQELRSRLRVESQEIMFKFQQLLSTVYESLCERNVAVNKLVTHLLSLGALDPVSKDSQKPLLQTFQQELRNAECIEDVLWVIRDYFSFFNYHVIEHIVRGLGTDQDKLELQNYKEEFQQYSKRRIYECPPIYGPISNAGHALLDLKVDSAYEQFTVKELENFQYRLSKIFCVSSQSVLRLCRVEKGSFQLIFQVPSFMQQEIFPLSSEQERALAAEDVIRLTCGDYQFAAKGHKNKSESEDTDPTLTTSNMLSVLSSVEERWEELGERLLEIPSVWQSKRDEIKRVHQSGHRRMRALINFYIRYHYAPSWQHFSSALQRMGLHDLADVVTTKYVQGPEERKHLAFCERAMKEKGCLEQTAMHCVFLGLPRSGKSSLIRRLLGKRLSVSTSTGVAEKAIKVEIRKSTAQVSGLLWCELEDLDDEAILLMCNLSKTAPVDVTALTTEDSQPGKAFSFSQFFWSLFTRRSHNKQHKREALSSPSLVESLSPGEQGMKLPLDVFRDAFRKKQSKLKELVDEPWLLYITDTGGQPEFQELLPILVSGPSLFFLVFSLHLELNMKFQVEYITADGKITVPYEAGLTVQEMLLQSLATIASTSVSRMVGDRKVVIQPNIFFVATHKDLVSEEHVHQVDITLQEVLKGTEAYKDGMVQFGSESQMIIAVNNLAEGEEDVQQIRAAVERIGKREQDYRVKTPFSWLMFSNIIQQMKSPVLKYEQCYSVAQQCGIDTREEMNDALRFLHENVGVVRYYHDVSELQGFVIKDPQYVFDVITELIVSTFTFDHADPVLHKQFTKKGIFPLDVFEKLAKSTEFLPPSKLVTLLQHLNIVALLKKGGASPHYFMPCVLAHSEGGKPTASSSTSRIPTLLVAFKSGYCPKGLFGALVVYLLQDKMKSKLEWELEQDKIFRDQIRFSVGPYDSFQLKVLPTYLSIDLCFSTGASERRLSLVSVCSEVRCCISSGIVKVSETLHCSQKAAFSFGFFCPEEVGTDKSSHPAIINFVNEQPCNLTCPLTHKRFDLPCDYQVWFNEVDPAQNSKPEVCVGSFGGCYPTLGVPLDLSGMNLVDHQEPEENYLSEEDLTDITDYLLSLEKIHVYNLGLVLGISQHKTKAMMDSSTFVGNVITAWLRREDQVKKKGEPSWAVLVRALEHPRVGQCRISQIIRKDKGFG